MLSYESYEYRVEGSGCELNKNGASLRLICNLSFLTCFDRAQSLHLKISVILCLNLFIFWTIFISDLVLRYIDKM